VIDGYCNLCNGFISIVYKNKPDLFYYTTINDTELILKDDSIAFIYENKTLRGAIAVIKILSLLSLRWRILSYVLSIFPNVIIMYLYKIIAANRYKVFGKKNKCDINSNIPKKYKINLNEEN